MNGMSSIKFRREFCKGVVVPRGGQLSVRRFGEVCLYTYVDITPRSHTHFESEWGNSEFPKQDPH